MPACHGSFGRMVLALPHSALDYPAVETAAELAECLGVQCVGTFIVEPAIASLSAWHGAQEFRSIAGGWQLVEGENLARDLEQVAESARRNFAAAIRQRGAEGIFHLVHGGTGQSLASLVRRDDIVTMIEPRHPADRITHQFQDAVRAAFDASSSVMLVPSRILRRHGPVVAVATTPNDGAIHVAAELARLMREPLLIINATGVTISRDAVPFDQQQVRVIASSGTNSSIETRVLADLEKARERLIVARRAHLDEAGTRVVADRRGVPVLLASGDGD